MSNGGDGSHAVIREERRTVMPDKDGMPGELDFTRPNVARMYDYYLGGCFL
jgi:hypothetical protein